MIVKAKRRLTLWMALLAVLALVAAACGDDGDTETDTAAEDASAETEEAATEEGATEDEGTEDEGEDAATEATQASGESCFDGETVTFVVSFDAGGGYDLIARTMAPYLEEELGADEVIVENEPGAGGILAMRNLQAAEPDGTTFGFFTGNGMVGSVIGGAEGADFNLLEDFSWVGRVSSNPRVLSTPGSSEELQTIEDVRAAEGLKYATAGPGANDYLDATIMTEILGIDSELVTGYTGSSETELALTTGDVQLASGTVGSRLAAIESGDHNSVLILGGEPAEELPDVPVLLDLDLGEMADVAESYVNLQEMGRMVWAPAGIPEDCLNQLISAFGTVLENETLISQLEAADQPIDWAPGDEMRETAQALLDAPPEFQALMEEVYQTG